jgi:hypothetical protein
MSTTRLHSAYVITPAQENQIRKIQALRNLYSAENVPEKLQERTVCHPNTTVYQIDKGACFREARERSVHEEPPPLDKIPERGEHRIASYRSLSTGEKDPSVLECFQMDPYRTVLGSEWDNDDKTAAHTFYERIVKKELDRRDLRFTGSIAGLATNHPEFYTRYNAHTSFIEFLRGKLWYDNVEDKGQLTHGHRHEQCAREEFLVWYRDHYKCPHAQVYEYPMMSSPECAFVGISVDGILFNNDSSPTHTKGKQPKKTGQSVVEIKCPFFKMHTDEHPYSPAIVKPEHMSQMQLYAGYLNRYFSDTYYITSIFFVVWQPKQTFITSVEVDDDYYQKMMHNMEKAYFHYFLPCLVARERKELGVNELLSSVEVLDDVNYQKHTDEKVKRTAHAAKKNSAAIPPPSSKRRKIVENSSDNSLQVSATRNGETNTDSFSTPNRTGISYENVFIIREKQQSHVSSQVFDWESEPNWLPMGWDDFASNVQPDDDERGDNDDMTNNEEDERSNESEEDEDDVETVTEEELLGNTEVSCFPNPVHLGEGGEMSRQTYRNWQYRLYIRCIYNAPLQNKDTKQTIRDVIKDAYDAWTENFQRIVVDLCSYGPPTEEDLRIVCEEALMTPTDKEKTWAHECEYIFPFSTFGRWSWLLDEFQSHTIRFYVPP